MHVWTLRVEETAAVYDSGDSPSRRGAARLPLPSSVWERLTKSTGTEPARLRLSSMKKETAVFSVLWLFFVVLFALAVLLWTGALGLQGLIYSEPAAKLYWRGPAAGAALTALIGVWCMMTYS